VFRVNEHYHERRMPALADREATAELDVCTDNFFGHQRVSLRHTNFLDPHRCFAV
jgi:hypothetical protein